MQGSACTSWVRSRPKEAECKVQTERTGFAIGPLLHGPASEVFGRKPVYVLSYFGFFAFETGVAFANNIGGMLIMRFLAGFCGCSSLNNAMVREYIVA